MESDVNTWSQYQVPQRSSQHPNLDREGSTVDQLFLSQTCTYQTTCVQNSGQQTKISSSVQQQKKWYPTLSSNPGPLQSNQTPNPSWKPGNVPFPRENQRCSSNLGQQMYPNQVHPAVPIPSQQGMACNNFNSNIYPDTMVNSVSNAYQNLQRYCASNQGMPYPPSRNSSSQENLNSLQGYTSQSSASNYQNDIYMGSQQYSNSFKNQSNNLQMHSSQSSGAPMRGPPNPSLPCDPLGNPLPYDRLRGTPMSGMPENSYVYGNYNRSHQLAQSLQHMPGYPPFPNPGMMGVRDCSSDTAAPPAKKRRRTKKSQEQSKTFPSQVINQTSAAMNSQPYPHTYQDSYQLPPFGMHPSLRNMQNPAATAAQQQIMLQEQRQQSGNNQELFLTNNFSQVMRKSVSDKSSNDCDVSLMQKMYSSATDTGIKNLEMRKRNPSNENLKNFEDFRGCLPESISPLSTVTMENALRRGSDVRTPCLDSVQNPNEYCATTVSTQIRATTPTSMESAVSFPPGYSHYPGMSMSLNKENHFLAPGFPIRGNTSTSQTMRGMPSMPQMPPMQMPPKEINIHSGRSTPVCKEGNYMHLPPTAAQNARVPEDLSGVKILNAFSLANDPPHLQNHVTCNSNQIPFSADTILEPPQMASDLGGIVTPNTPSLRLNSEATYFNRQNEVSNDDNCVPLWRDQWNRFQNVDAQMSNPISSETSAHQWSNTNRKRQLSKSMLERLLESINNKKPRVEEKTTNGDAESGSHENILSKNLSTPCSHRQKNTEKKSKMKVKFNFFKKPATCSAKPTSFFGKSKEADSLTRGENTLGEVPPINFIKDSNPQSEMHAPNMEGESVDIFGKDHQKHGAEEPQEDLCHNVSGRSDENGPFSYIFEDSDIVHEDCENQHSVEQVQQSYTFVDIKVCLEDCMQNLEELSVIEGVRINIPEVNYQSEDISDIDETEDLSDTTSEQELSEENKHQNESGMSLQESTDENTDSDVVVEFEAFDIYRIKDIVFFINFHGKKLLCVSIKKEKYLIMRDLLCNSFDNNVKKYYGWKYKKIYLAKERDLNIPYKGLDEWYKPLAQSYLEINRLPKNTGIITINDAKRLYHFFHGVQECKNEHCIRLWRDDNTDNIISRSSTVIKKEPCEVKESFAGLESCSSDSDATIPYAEEWTLTESGDSDNVFTPQKTSSGSAKKGKMNPSNATLVSSKHLPTPEKKRGTAAACPEMVISKTKQVHVVDSESSSDSSCDADAVIKGGIGEIRGLSLRFLVLQDLKMFIFQDMCKHFRESDLNYYLLNQEPKFRGMKCSQAEANFLNDLEPDFCKVSAGNKLVEEAFVVSILYNPNVKQIKSLCDQEVLKGDKKLHSKVKGQVAKKDNCWNEGLTKNPVNPVELVTSSTTCKEAKTFNESINGIGTMDVKDSTMQHVGALGCNVTSSNLAVEKDMNDNVVLNPDNPAIHPIDRNKSDSNGPRPSLSNANYVKDEEMQKILNRGHEAMKEAIYGLWKEFQGQNRKEAVCSSECDKKEKDLNAQLNHIGGMLDKMNQRIQQIDNPKYQQRK